jgi:hypothetical protein
MSLRPDSYVQRLDALYAFPTPTAAGRVKRAAPVRWMAGHTPTSLAPRQGYGGQDDVRC